MGFGLAIVDRLCRLLDHAIELDFDAPGKGSRFPVSVPWSRASTSNSAAPKAMADPASGKLIVVIDDDALVLDAMRGLLRGWGCRCRRRFGGSRRWRASPATTRPDLIISDYRLADGKTGIGAIERMRGALGVPIPAFLISGDTAPERLREASASGYHLLHKPVGPMALRAMLNQLLRGGNKAADRLQTTAPYGSATNPQPAANPSPAHPLQ